MCKTQMTNFRFDCQMNELNSYIYVYNVYILHTYTINYGIVRIDKFYKI